ncbi:MAG: GspE/PulE family protein, partial [Gammaproteobacteria bacterium]|nr:GspE/PulE family protein [Gammaproteobacteria bacterium]
MTTQVIDLPAPPLVVTSDDEELRNAKVAASLKTGDYQKGVLSYLSLGEGKIGLRDLDDLSTKDISLKSVRYLHFIDPLPEGLETPPMWDEENALIYQNLEQPFEIEFDDGEKLNGKTRSHVIDAAGLHLFRILGSGKIHRLFVPNINIQNYQVGPRLGDALIEGKALRAEDLNSAVKIQEQNRTQKLGDYLQKHAVISPDQLGNALDRQTTKVNGKRNGSAPSFRLGEVLVNEGLITDAQLNLALEEQRNDRRKKIGQILLEQGIIDSDHLKVTLARKLGIPTVDLRKFDIQPDALVKLPGSFCSNYHVIPISIHRGRLVVATDDPTNSDFNDIIRFITGMNIEYTLATREDIKWAIEKNYDYSADIEKDIDEMEAAEIEKVDSEDVYSDEYLEQEKLSKEQPIVKLVNNVLWDAVRRRASDILIRPLSERVQLIFRIDGELIEIRNFSRLLLPAIVARIKIISRLDIAEKQLPQDGRCRIRDKKNKIDFRVSVMPTVKGESVVIRVLNAQGVKESIDDLGLELGDLQKFKHAVNRNNGMILVTGPTSSGKTTTLYAALNEMLSRKIEIISIEDPVEYQIDEIEQIQINHAVGYTFARALKGILRHNPDAIMVGEIRDRETAAIALESALTGHLVLSTVHTKNAVGALARFIDMGIEPYVLSSTLLAVVAQRLVRKNCEHCLTEEKIDTSVREELGIDASEVFYKGAGCELCGNTGYY